MNLAQLTQTSETLRTWGRMGFWLPGWDRRSIWGADDMDGTLFAQLWRNDDEGEDPTVWISPIAWTKDRGRWPTTVNVLKLAEFIADGTGCTVQEARAAMAEDAPQVVKDVLLAVTAE